VRLINAVPIIVFVTSLFGTVQILAQSYPAKPVRIIVPFAAGGGTDILARMLAQRYTENLGQPFLVDNRTGANGNIGAELVAKANADGSTLLLTTNVLTTNPWLYKNMSFNVERDFAPITLAGSSPNLLVIHPSLPIYSVKELIALARKRPGELTIAGAGNGTPSHLAGELFKQTARVDLLAIAYKGTGASLNDLIGGQVMMSFGSLAGLVPIVKSGRIRALAVSSLKRNLILPEVPTVAETYPGFEVATWYGLLAPAQTSREIIHRLQQETVRALSYPELKSKLVAQGIDGSGMDASQFTHLIKNDLLRWQKVIRDGNIRAE
jgi:tripartite-type tricarboxylate transporter receptor subunit TctC